MPPSVNDQFRGGTRRDFLLAGAAGLAAAGHLLGAPARRPNILLIYADDHAVKALSAYHDELVRTPHIDRLADEGMRFPNAFSTNSLCAPSRACVLTGKYSHANGVRTNGDAFDGSQFTFPQALQTAGYRTGLVGKWHLRGEPTGFDRWSIVRGQGRFRNPTLVTNGTAETHEGYSTELFTDQAIDFLKGRDPKRPFCLCLHYKAAHGPWRPAEPYASLWTDKSFPEPPTFDDDYADRARAAAQADMRMGKFNMKGHFGVETPEAVAKAGDEAVRKWRYQVYIKQYLRLVKQLDANVGRLLDGLDEAGLRENTLVVYTSDQGFFLGEHGWYDKRFMYEESIRVPLLVRYPREVRPGTVDPRFALNVDLAPTFLDYAGVTPPKNLHGRSIRPLLQGKPPGDWRTSFYYQYYGDRAPHNVAAHYGIRTDHHKLIHYYKLGEWELFDLHSDPLKTHSVFHDPGRAKVRKQLLAELRSLQQRLGVPEAIRKTARFETKPKTIEHAAKGKPVTLATEPSPRYPGGGAQGLTDGKLGSAEFHDDPWLGFEGPDLVATIDLGEAVAIKTLASRHIQQVNVGIFLPKEVEFAISDDGKTFRTVATVPRQAPERAAGPLIRLYRAEELDATARYVRITARNIGTIPDWRRKGDIPAWLFCDEVLVNPR